MKHILIPVDHSDPSWAAVHCAISMHRDAGICFYLLHRESLNLQFDEEVVKLKTDYSTLQARIESTKKLLSPHQKLISLSSDGTFIAQVKEAVYENDIDLIVCSDLYPFDQKAKVDLTYTKAIITRVKCPVLIVPQGFKCKPLEQVVLLSDFNFAHRSKATNTLTNFVNRSQTHLDILQLKTSNSILTQNQVENKSFLKSALEQFSFSFHSVIDKTMDDALQFFINIHKVELVILFAKNINFLENILFLPVQDCVPDYRKKLPFLIIHE
ncbi:universal stress protein [Nonlabens ulvanivorans]|nr:universal stress protein [Nonlabens ulvanivorans]GAK94705.1 universal stress protein [Nonlabens ulvanivorans]